MYEYMNYESFQILYIVVQYRNKIVHSDLCNYILVRHSVQDLTQNHCKMDLRRQNTDSTLNLKCTG